MRIRTKTFIAVFSVVISFPVLADCHADIAPVKDKFLVIHDNLSEEDHMKIEKVIGEAVSFCYANREEDAQTKINEASILLANY